jgi:hypothetical protein
MMNFAALLECASLVAFLVIIGGGRQKREQGWKVLVGLLVLVALAQCFAMSTVVRMPFLLVCFYNLDWERANWSSHTSTITTTSSK